MREGMSTQLKEVEREESSVYRTPKSYRDNKVDLNHLIDRLNLEKKKERKNNLILSVIAVSAVAAFGVILTL